MKRTETCDASRQTFTSDT